MTHLDPAIIERNELEGVADTWETREDALRDVCEALHRANRMAWASVKLIDVAVQRFAKDNEAKERFLSDIADQTNVSVKTLRNSLSLVRNQSALAAEEFDLTLAHGSVLTKLGEEEAAGFAAMAAENRWTVADLRQAVSEHLGEVPVRDAVIVTLELEVNALADDVVGKTLAFLRAHWGAEIDDTLREWLAVT